MTLMAPPTPPPVGSGSSGAPSRAVLSEYHSRVSFCEHSKEADVQTTYPVASGFGNVFADLLGRETKRTDLGREGRRGSDLTTGSTEVTVRARVSFSDLL